MKVIADLNRCIGTGICESILPSVFEVGDEGFVIVHNENLGDDAGSDYANVRRAIGSCPTEALRVADDG